MKKRFPKQQPPAPQPQPSPKPSKDQVIKKQLSTIQDTIMSKLQTNQLSIPSTKIPYLSEREKQSADEQMYERIVNEKRKMEERIRELENTERVYADKGRNLDKSRVSATAYKGEITAEDKQNLKALRKKLKQFERSLEKKTIEIEEEKIRLKKQQEAKLAEERAAANQAKKARIEQKLQQIKQKNTERQTHKKMQDSALKKLQQKKKLFELLDDNWKQRNNQQEQRKKQLMQLNLKEKKINFAELREHEKKYEEIMSEKKRQLMEKRLSSSRQSQNATFSAQKSKFYTLVLKQQQKARQEQELKKQKAKQIAKKRQEYSLFVREEFIPKPKQPSQQEQPQKQKQPQQTKIIRLTKQQIVEMGNTNLRQGNKRAKKKQNLNMTAEKTMEQDKNKSTSKSAVGNYHDYLKEVRKKKQENKYYDGFYNSPRSEAEKIMKDDKIKKEDKIAKIKMLANRFDTSSADIVAKIQGKIQILQVIN